MNCIICVRGQCLQACWSQRLQVSKGMEYSSLEAAYLEEAVQAARFELFALRAQKDGRPRAAAFLRAVVQAKNVHAKKALMQLRGRIGATPDNMSEAEAMLGALPERFSELVNEAEGAPQSLLSQFLKTSMNHKARMGRLDEDADEPFHVCTVCGFIAEGDIPGRCPVCQALPEKFETESADAT